MYIMLKFFTKILIVVYFFFLLGFYFGDFNIGYINVKAKMRSMCECRFLYTAEKEFYEIRKAAKSYYRKINTHGIDH